MVKQFADDLLALRMRAGKPSFRKLASLSGRISHTTLHEAATGNRLASWETTREFVRACGGDEAEWRARWERAASAETSGPGPAGAVTPEPAVVRRWSRQRTVVVVAAVALLGTVIGALLTFRPDANSTANAVSDPPRPRVSGDHSRFIADITVPDGSQVKTNEIFVKVWEIQNSGTVPWYNRYLERDDLPIGPTQCQSADRIAIGNTLPNERVKINVTVTAPSTPGTCMVKWKMVDEEGRLFFPSSRPVYFLVKVVAPDRPASVTGGPP